MKAGARKNINVKSGREEERSELFHNEGKELYLSVWSFQRWSTNITIEFMFAGINMFWARLRLILARAVRRGLK